MAASRVATIKNQRSTPLPMPRQHVSRKRKESLFPPVPQFYNNPPFFHAEFKDHSIPSVRLRTSSFSRKNQPSIHYLPEQTADGENSCPISADASRIVFQEASPRTAWMRRLAYAPAQTRLLQTSPEPAWPNPRIFSLLFQKSGSN